MHFFYILFSKKANKYYLGETHNLDNRLDKHIKHIYSNSFTKIANDWQIILQFECDKREDAIYIEKFVKRMKSRKFIEKVIENPDILKSILLKK